MKLSIAMVARIVRGKIHGRRTLLIKNIAPPDEAYRNDLTFLFEPNIKTKAGAIITTKMVPGKISIVVKEPKTALYRLLKFMSKKPTRCHVASDAVIENGAKIARTVSIDHRAMIKKGVTIRSYTSIGSNCYIGSNVIIGSNCRIDPNAVINEGTRIGDHAVIGAGTVIGTSGFGFVKKKIYRRFPHIGGVKIHNFVEIGANCTIDRATIGFTSVGTGTKIDNLVHIAHNVRIGRNCMIMGQCGIAGSARLGNNVILCGQVGISDHVTIGDGAIVYAKSAVFRSIPRNIRVSGIPAREHNSVLRALARLYRET